MSPNLTPLLRTYAKHRRRQLAQQDAVATQERLLLRLVGRAANTKFGRDHDFARVMDVRGYQDRVPLRRYEDFHRDYWSPAGSRLDGVTWPGPIRYLALTSGTTTGGSKAIPVSKALIHQNSRVGLDLLVHHLAANPVSQILGGHVFLLGGSTDLTDLGDGVRAGDVSGILAATAPLWARPFQFPPLSIALMQDWDAKLDRLVAAATGTDIRVLGGTPSWLLVLFDRLFAATGATRLADVFPSLRMLVHGGVAFGPYRPQFERLLAGSDAELREVYPASEGFIALQDATPEDGQRLHCDSGLFFEFVPMSEPIPPDAKAHWLGNAEIGTNYALALSTCAGLWRYVLGDTVRLVSTSPPRIVITGRTSYSLSAFGEHLIAEEVDQAVTQAAEATGITVTDYAIGAVMPAVGAPVGHHLIVAEPSAPHVSPEAGARFRASVDTSLCALNDDYLAHRKEDVGLGEPRMLWVTPGSFNAWMASRGKLGGQHKVPRLIADPELFASLRTFMTAPGRTDQRSDNADR